MKGRRGCLEGWFPESYVQMASDDDIDALRTPGIGIDGKLSETAISFPNVDETPTDGGLYETFLKYVPSGIEEAEN